MLHQKQNKILTSSSLMALFSKCLATLAQTTAWAAFRLINLSFLSEKRSKESFVE